MEELGSEVQNLPAERTPEEQAIIRRKRRQDRRIAQATKIAKLKERDGNLCYLCETPLTEEDLTVDHVIPKAKGGASRKDNLRLTHLRCNNRKGDTSVEDLKLPFTWESDNQDIS